MKYIILLVNIFLVSIHIGKIIKLFFKPSFLSHKIFDTNLTKSYLIVYYLSAIFMLVLYTAYKFGYL